MGNLCQKIKDSWFKMESGSPEKGALTHTPLVAACRTSAKNYFAKNDIFHMGISSFLFKKKKEDLSKLQQQCTNHRSQPMRNRHNLELLFFSSELLFRTTLPSFLLSSIKAELPYVLQTYLWFAVVCLS